MTTLSPDTILVLETLDGQGFVTTTNRALGAAVRYRLHVHWRESTPAGRTLTRELAAADGRLLGQARSPVAPGARFHLGLEDGRRLACIAGDDGYFRAIGFLD